MDITDTIDNRHAIRSFKADAVEKGKLLAVLDAGRKAPSACNFQPWYFVVLVGPEVSRLAPAYGADWFVNAPAVIVVCCDRTRSWKRRDGKEFGDVDCAIALDHMTLAAAAQGLGTCWIGAFNDTLLRELIALPESVDPVVMTPLGYPLIIPKPASRKSLEEVVRWGSF